MFSLYSLPGKPLQGKDKCVLRGRDQVDAVDIELPGQPAQVLQPLHGGRISRVVAIGNIDYDSGCAQVGPAEVSGVDISYIDVTLEIEDAHERRAGVVLGIEIVMVLCLVRVQAF